MAKYLVNGNEFSFDELMQQLNADESFHARNKMVERSFFELCNVLCLQRNEREALQFLCNMYYNHGIATGIEKAIGGES